MANDSDDLTLTNVLVLGDSGTMAFRSSRMTDYPESNASWVGPNKWDEQVFRIGERLVP
jgi:hypothetical protein